MIFASGERVRLTVALDLHLPSKDGPILVKDTEALFSGIIADLERYVRRHPDDVLADGCTSAECAVTDAQGLTLSQLRDRGFHFELHAHVMEAWCRIESLRARARDTSGYERNLLNKEIEMVQACGATHVLVGLEFTPTPSVVVKLVR